MRNARSIRYLRGAVALCLGAALGAAPAVAGEAAAVVAAPAATPTAHDLLARSMEATGGEAVMAKIKNMVTKATFAMPAQGMTGKVTSYQADGKSLSHVEIAGLGKMEEGYDGTIGWAKDPIQGPRIRSEKELALSKLGEARTLKELEALLEKTELKGRTTFEGQDAWEVLFGLKGGFEVTVFIDAATYLMDGLKTEQETPMGKIPVTVVMTDYKEFSGLKIPAKVIQRMTAMGQAMEQSITIDAVDVNVADFPVIAAPPEIVALAAKAKAAPAAAPATN